MGKLFLNSSPLGPDPVGSCKNGRIMVSSFFGGDIIGSYTEESGKGIIYRGSGLYADAVGSYENGTIYRGSSKLHRDPIGKYDGERVTEGFGLHGRVIGKYEGSPAGAAALLLFKSEFEKLTIGYSSKESESQLEGETKRRLKETDQVEGERKTDTRQPKTEIGDEIVGIGSLITFILAAVFLDHYRWYFAYARFVAAGWALNYVPLAAGIILFLIHLFRRGHHALVGVYSGAMITATSYLAVFLCVAGGNAIPPGDGTFVRLIICFIITGTACAALLPAQTALGNACCMILDGNERWDAEYLNYCYTVWCGLFLCAFLAAVCALFSITGNGKEVSGLGLATAIVINACAAIPIYKLMSNPCYAVYCEFNPKYRSKYITICFMSCLLLLVIVMFPVFNNTLERGVGRYSPKYDGEEIAYDDTYSQLYDGDIDNYWAQDFSDDYNIPEEYLDHSEDENG